MFTPELLSSVRDRFHHVDTCPYQGSRAFFENAGGSLTLKSVVERTTELMAIPDNQGRSNIASVELGKLIAQGRADMMTMFGATSGTVFVGETGTELLGRIIRNATLATTGSSVVGSALEHPATISACRRWSEVTNRTYHQVPFDPTTSIVGVDQYREAITAETSVATIIHASPVTGMHVDVAAIAEHIRAVAPQCIIIVDGIQHAAHGQIDVESYGIDGYVVSGYKLFSRHNYGVAWVSDRLSTMPHDKLDGTPADFWELGTRDASAYATFSEVVRYLEWLGQEWLGQEWLGQQWLDQESLAQEQPIETGEALSSRELLMTAAKGIRAQEHGIVEALLWGTGGLKGLAELDAVSIVGPVTSEHRSGMVSFEVEGHTAAGVVDHLNDDGVRTHVRKSDYFSAGVLQPLGIDSCVRASASHYNSLAEVERLLATVNRLAGA